MIGLLKHKKKEIKIERIRVHRKKHFKQAKKVSLQNMKPKTITNILLQRTEKNIATTEERKKEYILRVGFVRELTI